MSAALLVHATAIALACRDGWRGALLRGPSGVGKSDLALRSLARGWRLIGDDYVHVFASADGLYAAPAERIAGCIEARGLGLLDVPHLPSARVRVVIDCIDGAPERLPKAEVAEIAGVTLPRLIVDIRPAAATVILAEAMRRL